MADQPLDKSQDAADELVRNEERQPGTTEPQPRSAEEIEQELEDADRFEATDN